MAEGDNILPLEERMKICPIHQWADIDDYLARAQVPESLWESFHELIVTRGQYSWNINDEDAKKFGREARAITEKHELRPLDAHGLKLIFTDLVGQWIIAKEREQ